MFSHKGSSEYPLGKDDWGTPRNLAHFIRAKWGPLWDPCPLGYPPRNPYVLEEEVDMLQNDWMARCYVNPPYSDIRRWAEKAYLEYKRGNFVVWLSYVRPDTRYFRDHLRKCQEIHFIEGRLHFNEGGPAFFPSMLCVFDPEVPEGARPTFNYIFKKDIEEALTLP